MAATTAQNDAIEATLFNTPDEHPLGSWQFMGWDYFVRGNGADTRGRVPFIVIEFVAAHVVHDISGDPTSFATTLWDQRASTASPPIQNASMNGWDYPDDFSDDQPVVRMLIRNDLDTGGAGPQWSGIKFMLETIHHELGHVTQSFLTELYGEGYMIGTSCGLFGLSTAAWNDHRLAWGDRIVEATAEIYKDVMFPARRYDNRTNLRVARGSEADYLSLYVDRADYGYWNASNVTAPVYRLNSSLVFPRVEGLVQPAWVFVTDEDQYSIPEFLATHPNVLRWPIEGDDPNNFTITWNFDPWPYIDPVAPTFGSDDEKREYFARSFDHVVIGVEFGSLDWVRAGEGFGWSTLLDESGTPITQWVEVNPFEYPDGTGSLTIELPPSLPAEGFAMQFHFPELLEGDWEFPPSVLFGGPVLEAPYFFTGFNPGPRPKWVPWAEFGPMRRPLRTRGLGWPYPTIVHVPGSIKMGRPQSGMVPVRNKVIGSFG